MERGEEAWEKNGLRREGLAPRGPRGMVNGGLKETLSDR